MQVCPTIFWGLIYRLLAPAGPEALARWYAPLSLALSLLLLGGVVVVLSYIQKRRLLDGDLLLALDVSAGLLSVTVIPYAHTYDQAILLAPFLLGYALTQREALARRRLARVLRYALVGTMLALPALLFALSLVLQADNWSLLLPLVLLLLLGACVLLPARPVGLLTNADMALVPAPQAVREGRLSVE